MDIKAFFKEGWLIGSGPLKLNVTKATVEGTYVSPGSIQDYETKVLEKILDGSPAIEIYHCTLREPLATGKEQYLADLERIQGEIRAENNQKKSQPRSSRIGSLSENQLSAIVLGSLIQDCDTYKHTLHVAIKDGDLIVYLGDQKHLKSSEAYRMLAGGWFDLDQPYLTIGRIQMRPGYVGKESSATNGDPVSILKAIQSKTPKFKYHTAFYNMGNEFDKTIFTVTRTGHNMFEVRQKRAKNAPHIPAHIPPEELAAAASIK